MLELRRHSPLTERSAAGALAVLVAGTVRLEELDAAVAVVRCAPRQGEAVAAVVAQACGWMLPRVPNTVVVQPHSRALWVEPGAWLITGQRHAVTAALAALRGLAESASLLTADVTGGRCMIGVSGPGARALIQSGCPLDLHPRVFTPGRCATSLFNEISLVIDQLSDAPAYTLIADSALALTLWDQLADAARWLE